jgi:hypothetical protein
VKKRSFTNTGSEQSPEIQTAFLQVGNHDAKPFPNELRAPLLWI